MTTIEDLKKIWETSQRAIANRPPYDDETLEKIIKTRMKKNMKKPMQYFWGSLFLQILVYALLSHVILKYGSDATTLISGIGGILLFVPFTVVLLKKFKQMAVTKPAEGNSGKSLYEFVLQQHKLLTSFYSFKKRYELLLIPLSTAIGVFLTFELFVPGGAEGNPIGVAITFGISLLSMVWSIRHENSKSFKEPLNDLSLLLDEFRDDAA
ncbi:MAG TPA: hypothetical protein VFZ52_25140 [Chryseolinea sp.]